MKFIRPPFFTKIFFPQIITTIKNNQNKIFLTFDDCNSIECTLKTIEILNKYDVKATFFCTGKNIQNNKFIIEEILKKKHKLGNHTFNHINGLKTKTQEYLSDIDKCNDLIKTNIFRPPYGKISFSQYNYLKNHYKIILWDIITYDFDKKMSAINIFKTIAKKTSVGSIIVFHTNENTQKNIEIALPMSIEYLKEKKFDFDIID